MLWMRLERFLVGVLIGSSSSRRVRLCTGLVLITGAVAGSRSFDDFGCCPAKTRGDVVGSDRNLVALRSVLIFPGLLVKPSEHDYAGAARDRISHVLGQRRPAYDVEKGDILHLFAVAFVAIVPSQPERAFRRS